MKFMRLIVMFDLPVKTKKQSKEATAFRNFLLKDGFYMVQYSIYARVCNGQDSVLTHKNRIKSSIPSNGSIRVLTITEKQYENIDILIGEKQKYDKNANYELISFFLKNKKMMRFCNILKRKNIQKILSIAVIPRIFCNVLYHKIKQ